MAQPSVEKAKIVNLNTKKEVDCHFNPAEFGIGQTLKWEEKPDQGTAVPKLVYSGAESQDMPVTFLFDTTSTGKDVFQPVVTKGARHDQVQLVARNGKGEPPQCRFQWGKFLTFNAVIKDIKQKFTLFAPNGTPLRAEVAVTFKQVGELTRGQNPTSRSEARKIWVVEEGQRLDCLPGIWRPGPVALHCRNQQPG